MGEAHPLDPTGGEGPLFAGGEAFVVEASRDFLVGVVGGEVAQPLNDGRGGALAGPWDLQLGDGVGLPAQAEMDRRLPPGQGHIFEQEAQQLLAVGGCGRLGMP